MVHKSETDGLRVAVVDDEPIARSRLGRLLTAVGGPSVQVVLECGTADEFLSIGPTAALDAAFVDIEMPGGNGLDAIERWPGRRPQMIIVTAHHQHAIRAFDVRAIDYLTKPVSESRLREALDRAHSYRKSSLRPDGGVTPEPDPAVLTLRQLEILKLVADDRSNKEIGRALELSPFTIRNHLSTLYRLFAAEGRRDLIARAIASGAVRRDHPRLFADDA